MFNNLAEIAKLMSKAKDIQSNLAKFKDEMPSLEFTAVAPGGAVSVTVSGDFQIKSIHVADDAPAGREELETLLAAAVNDALNAAKTNARMKMGEITGGLGMDLPGIF